MGLMKERPILMAGRMAQLAHTGLKTQTRRVVKFPQSGVWERGHIEHSWVDQADPIGTYPTIIRSPFGAPGDRLWVRETWCAARRGFLYRAECADEKPSDNTDDWNAPADDRWRPSIHMPRAACRTVLEVVSVRVERLQEMTERDAIAEGCGRPENGALAVLEFCRLWDELYGLGPHAWCVNPWVWVVEFRKV